MSLASKVASKGTCRAITPTPGRYFRKPSRGDKQTGASRSRGLQEKLWSECSSSARHRCGAYLVSNKQDLATYSAGRECSSGICTK